MQLHRLRLTAIGPFADPVDIDLDRLSASGIFLLEGPTGAGKSTLIDAIVFALYGDVAGRTSSTDRIASGVAPDGVTPTVELEFSTTHGMFRIRRTPKHQRRKRRGSGTTTEPASARLWRLVSADTGPLGGDALGEPVSTRIDEIGAEILDVVGLSREQFVQTVVLPQGEFATFLQADAERRRVLLQRLFGTEVYDRTVERLVDQRRQARQSRAAAATTVLGAVRAYQGAIGAAASDDAELAALVEGDADQLLVVVQQQLDALATAAAAARRAAGEHDVATSAVRADLTMAENRERARRRVVELKQCVAAMDAEADQLEADVRRLHRAVEAAPVMPALLGLAEAQRRAQDAHSALRSAMGRVPDPDLPPDGWSAHERALTKKAAELDRWVQVEHGIGTRRAELVAHEARREQLQQRLRGLHDLTTALPSTLTGLREQLTVSTKAAATVPVARDQLQSATKVLRAAHDLESASQRVDVARAQLVNARERARECLHREAALRERFIDGMAGHLAQQLQPGEPCPVCGSAAHPHPATAAADDVDGPAVEAAAEATAVATSRVEELAAELTALEAAAAQLRGVVGETTVTEATRCVESRAREMAAAETAEAECVRLRAAIVEGEQQLQREQRSQRLVEAEIAGLTATIEAAAAGVADDVAALRRLADGRPSVSDLVGELGQQASAWRCAIGARELATAADRDVQTRADEVEQTMANTTLQSHDEVRAAHLDGDERARLAASIDHVRATRLAYETELSSPELAGVDVDEQIDLETLVERVQATEQLQRQFRATEVQLTQRFSEASTRAAEIQTALSAQRAVHDVTEPVIRLADLVSAGTSDNARAMSLPTFVLRQRFVDVVASANQRLAAMSEGRFQLEHVEGRRGNRKSGLELQVRDSHTEHPRDPATLSGGETFYCSLALALGLADVVTSEAGGIDLGTLFVDEGFGSLDAETLDQVLAVLQGLATSGRAIGIVSHVPELKEQIAERISVVPNRDGSSRLIVAA